MADFKKLSDVEVVAEPSESANVLIEENGIIKKVHKDEVGGGVKKELVYEWNFSADDDVLGIFENVDDDLTWLLEKSDTVGWEMEFVTYAKYTVYEDGGNNYEVIDDTLTTTMQTSSTSDYVSYCSNGYMTTCIYSDGPEDFRNNWDIDYHSVNIYIYVYNKVHIDDDWTVSPTDIGGSFVMEFEAPIKSVKIYKVLR